MVYGRSAVLLAVSFHCPHWVDFAVIFVVTGMVLTAELFNTAIGALCDYVCPGHDPRIGTVNDVAAAAAGIGILAWAGVVIYEAQDLVRRLLGWSPWSLRTGSRSPLRGPPPEPTIRLMSNHENDDEVERLAAAFAALSNPQRLRMFIRLASTCCAPGSPGPGGRVTARRFCCATEVGEGLDLAPSTVSHHLKELRQAGLMHVERQGRRIDCWASREMLERIASFFAEWSPTHRQARPAAHAAAASGGVER